ncbi:HPP family protein, partial [Vibrio anguillarum]|nr:HPP family protein [Vibrio anguillarum]
MHSLFMSILAGIGACLAIGMLS